MVATQQICKPARAGPVQSRQPASSPPSIERVCFSPQNPKANHKTACDELRRFLSRLFEPQERIWFFPLMRKEIVQQHKDDPLFPDELFGRPLTVCHPDYHD